MAAAAPTTAEKLRTWNASAGPLVTKVIMALNVAVYILVAAQGGSLEGGGSLEVRLVLFGPFVADGDWYRLVTSGFVHFGLIHLGFNMFALYRFGEMMEPALGRVRMVALYLASLLAGSLGALLLSPLAFTAGASGAVFGILGASAVGMRQRGIDVWRSGIGPVIALNLFITFAIPGISIGGHLGGLAGGAAVGSVMLMTPPKRENIVVGVAWAAAVSVVCVVASVWTAGN